MTNTKSIGMRSVAAGDDASGQPVRRKGLFARFLEALHASRRRQALRYIHSYRHLLAEEYRERPQVVAIDPGKTEQGQTDANRDKRLSATIIECSRAHEANRVGVNPLIIAVIAAFAALHLVSGHMIEQSHASPSIGPSAFAAADDEAKCSPESPQPKPLPYD